MWRILRIGHASLLLLLLLLLHADLPRLLKLEEIPLINTLEQLRRSWKLLRRKPKSMSRLGPEV